MKKAPFLRTSELAAAVGIHPNTVRLYEEWGFLPPIPRSPGGYRMFTPLHLEQLRLARMALHGEWPGRPIRRSALNLVKTGATGDLQAALVVARNHLALVHAERAQAEAAADVLQRWALSQAPPATGRTVPISRVAERLDVTTDMLRDWERNGLIEVPRNPTNRYRAYGAQEIGRLRVIRLLRQAGYSTMAILRMVIQLDQDQEVDLRRALDTPRPDEDALSAADRWLSALAGQEQRALDLIAQVQRMIAMQNGVTLAKP